MEDVNRDPELNPVSDSSVVAIFWLAKSVLFIQPIYLCNGNSVLEYVDHVGTVSVLYVTGNCTPQIC